MDSPRVAIFDVDGTLLRGDSLYIASRRSISSLEWFFALLTCLPPLISWQLRLLSTARFKEKVLDVFGICSAINRADAVGDPDWLLSAMRSHLRPVALDRLRWHQRCGHQVLLCSASPRPLLQSLADWLGVELLCTELHKEGNSWQPVLLGANCKGPEKVRRVAEHIGSLEGRELDVYGDSKGDKELLQISRYPHYRSFSDKPIPYSSSLLGALFLAAALAMAIAAIAAFFGLPEHQRQALLAALNSLLSLLPILYIIVLLSYCGRYLRWRLLLTSLKIGKCTFFEFLLWFRGFALTATPAKLGELSRVQLLHQNLGYPRMPLVHVFGAERCSDLIAVAVLLLILAPTRVFGHFEAFHISPWLVVILAGAAVLALLFRSPLQSRFTWLLKDCRHHLPSDSLAKAVVPSSWISILVWSNEALVLWLLVGILSPVTIGIPDAIVIYLLSGSAGMASSLPGGIGVNEGSTVLLLSHQGVPVPLGFSIAILRRFITLWSIVLMSALLSFFPSLGSASINKTD